MITGACTGQPPRLFLRMEGQPYTICGVCVCPPVNVLKFLFYKVVVLKEIQMLSKQEYMSLYRLYLAINGIIF